MGVRNLDGRPFNFLFLANFGAKVKEYRSVKFCQLMSALYFMSLEVIFIASGVVGDFEDAPSERLCYFDYERSVLSQRSRKNSGRK
jgi:hypothetical protein